jgi:hypothetical protein
MALYDDFFEQLKVHANNKTFILEMCAVGFTDDGKKFCRSFGMEHVGNTVYPNPFNPETTIHFSIPVDTNVTIDIFNVKGQKVKSLVNDMYQTGNHIAVWSGHDNNGRAVSSGIYFYRMQTDGYTATKKMLLLK